jgi:RNA polymerase sigma factor FliA
MVSTAPTPVKDRARQRRTEPVAERVEPLAGDRARRDELVLRHMRLVPHVVRRMAARVPAHVSLDDLLAAGTEGLLRAAERFDPARGVAFSTFAGCSIRGSVLDALREMDPLARPTRERVSQVEQAETDLAERWGAQVPTEEIAAEVGLSGDEVRDALYMRRAANFVSLDEDRGEGPLSNVLADPTASDAMGRLLLEEARTIMHEEVAQMPETERRVLVLYYGDELLLREIAVILGVTEGRVSQIHKRALERLRAACRRRGLLD